MNKAATILQVSKPDGLVKRLLTPEEKAFVSLISQIIVTKTFNDAKNLYTIPKV